MGGVVSEPGQSNAMTGDHGTITLIGWITSPGGAAGPISHHTVATLIGRPCDCCSGIGYRRRLYIRDDGWGGVSCGIGCKA